ncbi:MAG: single-stranded-DNA-specific exonuclease RecJ [Candidatus Latescibacterota bacterium]|nr:MAG: single-stranded-DNA-specific exonuclease RecJ [Candidatus Latescibacterota bacterium]
MHVWHLQPVDERVLRALEDGLGLSPLEARLLASRGVSGVDDAHRILNPAIEHLHDPFLFNEMAEATRILHEAIARRDKILVHGDYDADGVCGTALLVEVLSRLGADVHFFVPDRAKDGYGLARRVMDRGFEAGLKLVVSVDCGSSDREVVAALVERGVKVVVTDHHETALRIPEAHAFVNPKLPGERYPFKELTGTGVAFKLLQGLERAMGVDLSLAGGLDLVALGTLGDSGAMLDENRVLVSRGLEVLREWRRPGLRALRDESGLSKNGFSTRQLSFTVIPRINSPGRIGSARAAVDLLVTADEAEATRIARQIGADNERRKELGNGVIDDAVKYAEYRVWHDEPKALVFSAPTWHEGVVGIAAARLAERYDMPAVLIAVRGGFGKGSARSAGKVNVKEALERCSRYLVDFGGHKEAGGFSIREEDIPDFQRLFEEVVEELVSCPSAPCALRADAEAVLADCTLDLSSFIERLGPFGTANPEPLLMISNLKVVGHPREVGGGHLKFEAADATGEVRDLIGFSIVSRWKPEDVDGKTVDVLAHMRKNTYQGKTAPQIQIGEMRLSGTAEPSGSGAAVSGAE